MAACKWGQSDRRSFPWIQFWSFRFVCCQNVKWDDIKYNEKNTLRNGSTPKNLDDQMIVVSQVDSQPYQCAVLKVFHWLLNCMQNLYWTFKWSCLILYRREGSEEKRQWESLAHWGNKVDKNLIDFLVGKCKSFQRGVAHIVIGSDQVSTPLAAWQPRQPLIHLQPRPILKQLGTSISHRQ